MKKLMLIVGLFLSLGLDAQDYVNQVLILNEGYFDYVTGTIVEPVKIGTYDPINATYEEVAILEDMRFASDLIINGEFYYVAADTKIFKLNLNTHEIVASSTCEGVRNLAVYNDRLFATRGEYLATFDSYVHVFNKNDLSLEAAIDTVAGPKWATQNLIVEGNKVYVAVNNAFEYQNEKGIVGVIDGETLIYEDEIDLGPNGKNPDNLLMNNGEIYTVNNKDWSGTSVSKVSLDFSSIETVNIESVSTGCGTSSMRGDKIVYQISMESDLNEFDCALMNTTGPVNGNFVNFHALNENPLNDDLYASETDFFSYGKIHVYNTANEEIGFFNAGITPGKIVFDVRSTIGLSELTSTEARAIPNPSKDFIQFVGFSDREITITNTLGKEVEKINSSSASFKHLPSGIYYASQESKIVKFIIE
jgi:hypothetical protein